MTDLNLKVVARARKTGKAGRKELAEHDVRGVVYGKDVKPTPFVVDYNELNKVYKQAGANHVVELEIDGDGKHQVLFKDVDLHPVTNRIRHFDFYAVKKGEKVEIEVPVRIDEEGSPAEKKGLNVAVLLESVLVWTLPTKIPDSFELSSDSLQEVGDTLSVADIKVTDKDIEILTEPETLIAKVEEIKELQVEDADAETAMPESEHGTPADNSGEESKEA